jgi:predicted transcriptional regulator
MNINKAIGVVVSQYIKEQGIDNIDLANRSNLSRTTLYRIITGYTTTTDTLLLLSKGMNTKLSTLISKAENLMNS